jgi:TonB family protein
MDRINTAPLAPKPARLVPAGLALLAHGTLLILVARLAVRPPQPAPDPPAYELVMERAQPAPRAEVLATGSTFPAPPAPLAALNQPALEAAFTPPPRHARAAPRRQPPIAATPNPLPANMDNARPATPGPMPPPQDDDGAALASLEARIDAAVREAAVMPDAARRQHRQGSARLRFRYLDGVVDGLQVIASSNSQVLDDAALRAVRTAHYPVPSGRIRGRALNLLVWIDFRLTPSPG